MKALNTGTYLKFAPVQQAQIAKYGIENGLKPSSYTSMLVFNLVE